jgi:hypothetical protein
VGDSDLSPGLDRSSLLDNPGTSKPSRRSHRQLARDHRPKLEAAVLSGVVLWALLPLAVLLGGHGVFNGGYGIDVADLMQYMGFIRQAGEHLLIANPFDVAPNLHVFFQPTFELSGLAWWLGASIQLALLLWVPLTVAALCLGFTAYVRRMLGRGTAASAVALLLAFFYVAPAMPLASWLHASQQVQFGTKVIGLEMFTGSYASGGGSAIAVAMMPVFLLSIEKLLEPSRPPGLRTQHSYAIAAGVAGMLASWIHPWQGLTLLAIVAGLVVWSRFDRNYLRLALPVVLTAAPLAYFFALSHTHSSWMVVSRPNNYSHFGTWLVLGMVPLVAAVPGFPGRNLDVQERIVRIWPVAAFLVYLSLNRTWFYHAFDGLSLPLSILTVIGWRTLRVPRSIAAGAALAVTIPGMVWFVQQLVDTRSSHFFTSGEARALAFLNASPRKGAVLAPVKPLGQAVPGFTGRQTFVGHYYWTPDYYLRVPLTEALFDGRLTRTRALALVQSSRATFLAADCQRARVDLTPLLGQVISRVWRFGCATVYEVR